MFINEELQMCVPRNVPPHTSTPQYISSIVCTTPHQVAQRAKDRLPKVLFLLHSPPLLLQQYKRISVSSQSGSGCLHGLSLHSPLSRQEVFLLSHVHSCSLYLYIALPLHSSGGLLLPHCWEETVEKMQVVAAPNCRLGARQTMRGVKLAQFTPQVPFTQGYLV